MNMYDDSDIASLHLLSVVAGNIRSKHNLIMFFKLHCFSNYCSASQHRVRC